MKVKIINTAKAGIRPGKGKAAGGAFQGLEGSELSSGEIKRWIQAVCDELKSRNIPLQPPAKTTASRQRRKGAVLEHTGHTATNLTVAFISKQEIQKLNHRFRKNNSATDILSFAPVEEGSLGELAFCLPVIYQSIPKGWSGGKWLYYLILHGLLHLLGFDHEKGGTAARQMYQLQDRIFKKLIKSSPCNQP